MPVESTYSVLKSGLSQQLASRPGLANTNVLTYVPVNKDDIRTPAGTYEVVAMADAEGTFDDVVFCAGDLRFDETLVLTVLIEVQGVDSNSTQAVVDARVNELLFEVLAEIASQNTWTLSDLGLDVFDYIFFTPQSQSWGQGRIQQTSVFAANVEIGLEVRSRRTFS